MNTIITIPPTIEPVSLTAMKLHMKVESSVATDDELIKSLIVTARQMCESYEGQSYIMRTCQATRRGFRDLIYLPFFPVVSVSSVQYVDPDGNTQTLASTYYTVYNKRNPCEVRLAYGQSWPATRDVEDSVIITYVAGYGTSFTSAFSTALLTVINPVFADTDAVRLFNDINDLPASLANDTTYYARDVSGSTLKLAATSGGTALTLTDDGTVPHMICPAQTGPPPARVRAAMKLMVAHWYEHREEASEINLTKIPNGAFDLLFERTWA